MEGLLSWEDWQGDPGVDVNKMRRGLEVAGRGDYEGEFYDMFLTLREKLKALERRRKAGG